MMFVDYYRAKLELRYAGEEGATAVEYGIMVALIAVVIIAAVYGIGQALKGDFETVEKCLKAPSDTSCV
ncbi:Flp family type IVb pilin [Nitriliruptor alkaliphilus]|uniref:Flp family type IVb pilin n=1 Tax=Nitriliruptor alkaliphilus TaxID=427918 RepID=UPI000ABEC675|nr:Flp family type IVb pilin [Nitriliruptor alkaliphilus]